MFARPEASRSAPERASSAGLNTLSLHLLDRLPDAAHWPAPPPDVEALPTQTAAWTLARAGLLAPQEQPHWLAAYDAGGLAALAPLVRGRWLRELPLLYEPADFAWRSPDALLALTRALARQGRPLVLERVPEDSPTVTALRQAFAGRGHVRIRPAMPTPMITLDASWSEPEGAFSARRRADFRRYERRAARRGSLEYLLLAPDDDASLSAAVAEAFAVESRSWKAWAGTAITSDPRLAGFFEHFMREAAAAGVLRIALLRLGGRPAAMQIALQWRQRFWLFKIAHDQAFDDCSPGQLLMRYTLLHAARSGLASYEFMGLMDDWTRLWTQEMRRHVRIVALPYSVTTAVVLARRAARAAVDRVRRQRG